jgi:NTP pyrophosphatase (non-canonical NTP hydrolase)
MQDKSALGRTIELVRDLRARCLWDRVQTRETLRPYLVEEVLELDQAIAAGDGEAIRDELGDFLLHLAWQIVLAEELGEITVEELADRVASGELDVEGWLANPLATAELLKEMKGVKGVGPYAAENLLKLLGRYDGLALDSWTRAKFFAIRNNGRKTTDKKIARYYSRFKEWRGLALWCDVTRDWLDAD